MTYISQIISLVKLTAKSSGIVNDDDKAKTQEELLNVLFIFQ